jgi:subtilase family serine protease
VDADDNPNIALDLYMFSVYWGLPLCGAGCFTKVDQSGGTNYPPPASSGWNLEIALDVEWAHALAPGAHILLVEANADDGPSFFAAERYAGANAGYVLNSWGTPEFAGEAADDSAFADPGVSYFASVPDEADQTQYPATSPNVVAVGGDQPTAGGVIPWPSSGGGCSAYESAYPAEAGPSSQAGCAGKQMTPEVTADAAGIPVWDAASGWWSAGGTSFATVLWGAAAADSGQVVNTSSMYAGSIPLRPVVGGTPLETGLGDLGGAIPVTLGEFFNMLLAQMG